MSEFFNMGGYGFYVWSSYGISFIVLAATVYAPILKKKKVLADISRKARRARKRL